jgi:c-di-AMP phosphodiesterase-like protein
MNIIQKIRISIGNKLYKKKVALLQRNVKATGLPTVKTACIIIEANNAVNLNYARELRKHIPEKAIITIIGFIDGKIKNYSYISDKTYNYIDNDDFDFFMQPKSETLKQLIKNKFDILFVLSNNYCFEIDLIAGLSEAQFKVGQSGLYEKNFDLYIDTNSTDIYYLISQIVYYMG